jgi:hypothetical protein
MNPNTLFFEDKQAQDNYLAQAYTGRQSQGVSAELKNALIIFYFFTVPYLTLIFAVSLAAYLYNNMTLVEAIFHCTVSGGLTLVSFGLLKSTLNSREVLLKTHYWYGVLASAMITYFLFGDARVYYSFLETNSDDHRLKVLGVVCTLFLLQLVVFYNFFIVFLVSAYTVILHGALQFGLTDQSMAEKVWDFLSLLIVIVAGLFWCHQYDFRCKQIFWRLKVEERTLGTIQEEVYNHLDPASITSGFERLVQDCDELKRQIKASASVIIFKDVRKSLKDSATLTDHIKRQIVYGMNQRVTMMQPDLQGLDQEDKEFIHDHYADFSRNFMSRSSSVSSLSPLFPANHIGMAFSELEELLNGVGNDWSFDIWKVHESTGRSVSVVGKYLLHKWGYFDKTASEDTVVDKFLLSLEAVRTNQCYRNNPYHNACHAADVMHSALFFILNSEFKKYLDQLELLALTIAALGHDAGHPGLTNRFLVNARDKLAIKYNDSSVLENMHCSTIYKLLQDDDSNILASLGPEDWVRVRKIVVEMILGTDLAKHFEIVSVFKTRAFNVNDISFDLVEDKLLVLKLSLKCADISHSSKPLVQHQQWTDLVCQEFFLQGDREKELGLPVSMYCDRDATDLPKSQAGFLKNICLPLFECFATFMRSEAINSIVLSNLRSNLSYWETTRPMEKDPSEITFAGNGQ